MAPQIARVWRQDSFDEAPSGLRAMAESNHLGKLVVTIDDGERKTEGVLEAE